MAQVVIVDYGSGNLRSVAKAVRAALAHSRHGKSTGGSRVVTTGDADTIAKADYLVLPGVGAFADCWAGIHATSGVHEAISTTATHRPFLGICVGMQLMAEYGLEGGTKTPGFGWVKGNVAPMVAKPPTIRVPHMGWNTLNITGTTHPIFAGLDKVNDSWFYFLHGYGMTGTDKAQTIATTDYGGEEIVAAVASGTRIGVQFHPEKSQTLGQRLLINWLNWRP